MSAAFLKAYSEKVNLEIRGGAPKALAIECSDKVHGLRVAGDDGQPLDLASPAEMQTGSGSQFVVLARHFAEYALEDAAAAERSRRLLHERVSERRARARSSSPVGIWGCRGTRHWGVRLRTEGRVAPFSMS